MAVAALWAAEATSIRLPLEAVQADFAEVVAARKQVGVAVQVQAHRAGELILEDAGLLRRGRGHVSIYTVKEDGWRGMERTRGVEGGEEKGPAGVLM